MSEKFKSPFPERQLTGQDFNDLVDHINSVIDKSDLSEERLNEVEKLSKRIDGFYEKIIEIVGIFIAIFSFIIAGIQISFRAEGDFKEILFKSLAVFISIILSIIVLILLIKWIIKK